MTQWRRTSSFELQLQCVIHWWFHWNSMRRDAPFVVAMSMSDRIISLTPLLVFVLQKVHCYHCSPLTFNCLYNDFGGGTDSGVHPEACHIVRLSCIREIRKWVAPVYALPSTLLFTVLYNCGVFCHHLKPDDWRPLSVMSDHRLPFKNYQCNWYLTFIFFTCWLKV